MQPAPQDQLACAVRLLDDFYGRPVLSPRYPPVDELVFTVLSQNTADVNTERTFASLKARFPQWTAGRDATPEEIEDGHRAGRPGAHQGAAHQEDPRGDQRAHRRARPGRARRADRPGGAGLPDEPPGRGPQDGRLRAALLAGAAGDAGRHARAPHRPPARHHRREGDGRAGAPAAHRAGRGGTTRRRSTPRTWTSCGTAAASATPGGPPAASARWPASARPPAWSEAHLPAASV